MSDDPISFWQSDGIAWARPSGDCCHLNATPVKVFVKEMVRRGYRDVVVDLDDCTGMDETFMGTLVGAALLLRKLERGPLRVVHCPPELDTQFRDLGLNQLFDIVSNEIA